MALAEVPPTKICSPTAKPLASQLPLPRVMVLPLKLTGSVTAVSSATWALTLLSVVRLPPPANCTVSVPALTPVMVMACCASVALALVPPTRMLWPTRKPSVSQLPLLRVMLVPLKLAVTLETMSCTTRVLTLLSLARVPPPVSATVSVVAVMPVMVIGWLVSVALALPSPTRMRWPMAKPSANQLPLERVMLLPLKLATTSAPMPPM